MTPHLYLAPAGHGKTAYVIERIRQVQADAPLEPVTVILPNQAQVNAFRQRLSAAGGALGINLGTFYTLYAEILAWAGKPEPRLPEPVQYRLLRSIIVELIDAERLPYYAPLRDKPGFVVAIRALVEELKRARVHRDEFRQVTQTLAGRETRLTELAEIYTAYQDWLYTNRWADTEGQGWLAALALERQPDLARRLRLLIIDGFDEFNPTQLAVLKLLAERAAETIITLTGDWRSSGTGEQPFDRLRIQDRGAALRQAQDSGQESKKQSRIQSRPALRRFSRALQAVRETLNLEPEPLPGSFSSFFEPTLAYLEANLFETHSSPKEKERTEDKRKASKRKSKIENPKSKIETVAFVETQNRAEEVRAALRWLKARLIRDQMAPAEVALIARDLTPYCPFIEEIAAEFGLTLHLREGLNLAANPAIAALMSLLALPLAGSNGEVNWARRPLIDAWRSPYFGQLAPGLTRRQVDQLDLAARQGLVMQGLDQWRAALRQQVHWAARRELATSARVDDEDFHRPDQLSHSEALTLQSIFEAFVSRISPPPQATLRDYAAFVEDLIGDDPKLATSSHSAGTDSLSSLPQSAQNPKSTSLDIVSQVWAVSTTAARDIAALRTFKDVLRGLVLAESSLRHSSGQALRHSSKQTRSPAISYSQFYEELHGAVQGATYYLPPPDIPASALPVLSVLNARGISFRAVALIGLAEGDFPRLEREDILLREEDRQAMRQTGLTALESHLRGDEITLFYQAVTRAREKLLLCRPYLADDGHAWEPSPYWREVQRLVEAPVQHIRPEDPTPLAEVASLSELMQAGALAQFDLADFERTAHLQAEAAARLQRSVAVLQARLAAEPQGPYEGDLTLMAEWFKTTYGPEHVWSSSRLEAYGLCPHHFWLGQDLLLEAHRPPQEGFDVFILGSMYHEILEKVYRQVETQTEQEHLLALLSAVAKDVFDEAPQKYGFRPTPLWEIQRPELEKIVGETLVALAEATADSVPLVQEQVFGLDDQPPLVVQNGDDEFRVRGFIDRVDQLPDGRLRIIDYKSGSTPIAARDLSEGRRLQIVLYALAARDALVLGDIADGFYWHIGSAKASNLKLDKFEGGVENALNTAIAHAFNHIAGARGGYFPPIPPAAGCPGHCPGASFCWRYKGKGY